MMRDEGVTKAHTNSCACVPMGKFLMVLKRGAQYTCGTTERMHVIEVGTHWAIRKDLHGGFVF